ncbi:MAG: YggS family pyridoxal phosphate-dependent enzyme [Treponema sp.]|nr:YggS family pyridoxal phosphate-dependent enzyme [Candidatus Treponema equifaecale]
MTVKENLLKIKKSISDAEKAAARTENSVKLVAVSKFHPLEKIIEAIDAGQVVFGENRVQEAKEKFTKLFEMGYKPELHIIGSLQRNKVKDAVKIASCIESLDRLSLAEEIEKQCAKIEKKIQVLFEIHTGEESKAGFTDENELRNVIQLCADGKFPHLEPKGFMTMAPNTENQEEIKKSFVALKDLQKKFSAEFPVLDFSELSMGMSGDFPLAIECGSTMVRIGTAIFGEREY